MDDDDLGAAFRAKRFGIREPAFDLGDGEPRRCGEDPDMPPGPGRKMPEINLGYPHLKRGR